MKSEVLVAIIGASGVVLGGVVTNINEIHRVLSGGKAVTAAYEGYAPTGDFATELRYFMDVSGARAMSDSLVSKLAEQMKAMLVLQFPGHRKMIENAMTNALEEAENAANFDDVIKLVLPIYQKHYSVPEIQELNRFYSTKLMRGMVRKNEAITSELAPKLAELIQSSAEKARIRLIEQLQGTQ